MIHAGLGDLNEVVFLQVSDGGEVLNVETVGLGLGGRIVSADIDHDGELLGLGIVVSGGLGQIGVDGDDENGLGIVVNEDLGQNALAGAEHGVLVALGDLAEVVSGLNGDLAILLGSHENAVQIVLVVIIGDGAVADVGVDILALDRLILIGQNEGGRVGVGADVLGAEGPGVGGTTEGIVVSGQVEVGVVLLTELDGVAALVGEESVGQGSLADALSLSKSGGDILSLGSADVDLSAVDGDVAALVGVLDQRSLDGVQAHLGSLLTGENAAAADLQTVEQTGLLGDLGDADLPVGAGEALDGGVIAERAEEHLGELEAGQLAGGVEGAVAHAVDDLLGGAIVNVAGSPVGGRDVTELVAANKSLSGLVAEHQVADDLGSFRTGQVCSGVEVEVVVADENADSVHNINGLFAAIRDLVIILESRVADGDEGHGHDQRQHQSE